MQFQFGKQLQAEIIPGWSEYYLDYKFLKKIVSSLAAKRPGSEAASLALGIRPGDLLSQAPASSVGNTDSTSIEFDEPSILSWYGQEDDRGPDFQAHKAAFFFKLERELEKINAFYLRKEAELKLRLETLLSKRRAAALRVLPDDIDDTTQNYVEWKAVEEGFHLLERDIAKLQQFIEINATGFRKILKKWDKRSKSTTKELYLARQVEVQPVFNRQLISELSDIVTACLVDITDVSSGLALDGQAVNDLIFNRQMSIEGNTQMGLFRDLESNLRKAVTTGDQEAVKAAVLYSNTLGQQQQAKVHITRILWRSVVDAPPDLADLIMSSTSEPFDFKFVDDINGRTCLHEAAITGAPRLVDLCLENEVQPDKVDAYGRSAFHYAAMNGHADICRRLLESKASPYVHDMENYTPIVYATLKGSVDCVRVLLEEGGVSAQPTPSDGDLIPLSLASLAGHMDVVLLLLEHGARSLPNSNGEFPIHFAARKGHADICQLLVRHEGWDVADKYNEWTPLVHAARYGHASCVKVLLEAGSRTNVVDELGNSPIHYAAWYGHQDCVALLLTASTVAARDISMRSPSDKSTGSSALRAMESDIDMIPSLSLPPPMMPHRVYGHNYLDRQCLVQVTIGHTTLPYATPPDQPVPAVRLHSRLMGTGCSETALLSSPLFKLVMTSSPNATSAPHTISLPLLDEVHVLTFQTPLLDQLSLEFSLYPNFGTKTIGRAIALPSLFSKWENNELFTLPILDHRLHVIGEVSFTINIITPFEEVTLEIGGAVETYWKSLSQSQPAPIPKRRLSSMSRARPFSSVQASPSGSSHAMTSFQPITISSVSGSYVYLTVQVTRDLHPVVFADWRIPENDFYLGVADITLAQFESLAERTGRDLKATEMKPLTASEWYRLSSAVMLSLEKLMKILPISMGVCLELAYLTSEIRERNSFGHNLPLNQFIDSVLRAVYHTSAALPGGHSGRRKIIFTSFSPDVCAAVNWKQPNYPVFFASQCGEVNSKVPSATALSTRDARDQRLSSLSAAVEFCKDNNLLGVFVDTELLDKVPSLIRGVRDGGILVGTYNAPTSNTATAPGLDGVAVDAFFQDGVFDFRDHFVRA
ncbi:hypothetical protein EW146_g6378 [Bondarzewia mesenterica]|uniref:SPX domain-containing protein n=1 Tax=Bondarzewia mesenterica TaxID=1095465 RepID=A0A4S4LNQ8_9AGAM|nr:hypothetical protein EW146_g6378 [Bondarzewia mesenterica]